MMRPSMSQFFAAAAVVWAGVTLIALAGELTYFIAVTGSAMTTLAAAVIAIDEYGSEPPEADEPSEVPA